jgi:hypothetical protein
MGIRSDNVEARERGTFGIQKNSENYDSLTYGDR